MDGIVLLHDLKGRSEDMSAENDIIKHRSCRAHSHGVECSAPLAGIFHHRKGLQ
jgi:hypothetical protein